jgi:hypothetical protein
MKCFAARFLLIPDSSQISTQVLARQKADIYSEDDFEKYEDRFVRFIENLNKIRLTSIQRGTFLPATNNIENSAPIRRKVASAPQSIGRVKSIDNSPVELKIITDSWLKQLQQTPKNITIAKKSIPLPSALFVSYDLVCWLMSKIPNMSTKEEAINYANQMLQNKLIRLVPNKTQADEVGSNISLQESDESVFRYGYNLYLVVTSTVDADIMYMEDKPQVLVSICDFCKNEELAECKFTSYTIPMEITNNSFNVRHIESKFMEWCRVGLSSDYSN